MPCCVVEAIFIELARLLELRASNPKNLCFVPPAFRSADLTIPFAMDAAVYRKLHPRSYLRRFLTDASVRADGRALNAARRANLTAGSVSSALGSAMVKLGRTTAVAGISGKLVPPAPGADAACGTLDVSVHVLPLAGAGHVGSSGASGGGLNADVACIAAFVRETVAGHVELASLCVEKETLVWALKLTLYCVDHDGNMEDAMVFAATAALLDVRLPTVRMIDDLPSSDPDAALSRDTDDDGSGGDDAALSGETAASSARDGKVLAVFTSERTNRLEMNDFSLSFSFVTFEDFILLDPSRDEESVADSRITLVLRSNGELRAVHKPGGNPVPIDAVRKCLVAAQSQLSVLLNLLDVEPATMKR